MFLKGGRNTIKILINFKSTFLFTICFDIWFISTFYVAKCKERKKILAISEIGMKFIKFKVIEFPDRIRKENNEIDWKRIVRLCFLFMLLQFRFVIEKWVRFNCFNFGITKFLHKVSLHCFNKKIIM